MAANLAHYEQILYEKRREATVSRHPTNGNGVPMDRQAGLCIALECTRHLGMVHHDGLKLAVSFQVSTKQEGEMVLECFKAWGRLLLPRDVWVFRHFLPLLGRFIDVEDLLRLVRSLLDDGPEMIRERSSGILVGALSLS